MIVYVDNKIANKVDIPNSELAKEFGSSVTYQENRGHWPMLRIFGTWMAVEKNATADWEGIGREQALTDQDEIIALVCERDTVSATN